MSRSLISNLLVGVIIFTGCIANAATLPPAIRTACGLDQDTYLEIIQKQIRQFEVSEWVVACDMLRTWGFDQPGTILRRAPNILMTRDLVNHPAELRRIGFKNSIKLIKNWPAILGLNLDQNIKPKINALATLGFKNPIKMIENSPVILGLNLEENIKPKINALATLGFINPLKMIETLPAILGLNLDENIKPKIDALDNLGCSNVLEMLESHPPLLGLSFKDNIRPTIDLLVHGWGIEMKTVSENPMLIGASIARVANLLKYLRERDLDTHRLPLSYKKRLIQKLKVVDLESNFDRAGATTAAQQTAMLRDPRAWPRIFQRSSCEKIMMSI